jgi:hypothetical protein
MPKRRQDACSGCTFRTQGYLEQGPCIGCLADGFHWVPTNVAHECLLGNPERLKQFEEHYPNLSRRMLAEIPTVARIA